MATDLRLRGVPAAVLPGAVAGRAMSPQPYVSTRERFRSALLRDDDPDYYDDETLYGYGS